MDPVYEHALQKIHPRLRDRPGARFVAIINGTKKPEGKDWAGVNGANYGINDAPLAGYLAEGHNYGVLCGVAGITVPDLDDTKRLGELGIMKRIPETCQVQTGRGGRHVYFDCTELDHQIGLYDPELKDADGEPLHLGEIQSKGQHVVGPGSIHPNGNKYEVINDAPILKISKADLLAIFDGLILTGIDDPAEEPGRSSERRRKSGGSSIGDSIPIDQVAWPKTIKERKGSEVVGSHPLHGSKSGKNFSVNTAKNCWHCFRCGPPKSHRGGGGPLEWLAVEAGLIACKDARPGCLDDKALFVKVLQIAKSRGFIIPDKPKEEQKPKSTTLEKALLFIADRCDGANSEDGQGFSKTDVIFGKAMAAKVRSGQALREDEYKNIHKMLGKYNTQLTDGGMDVRLIPKEQPAPEEETTQEPEFAADILAEANRILDEGKGFEYAYKVWQKRHHGDENLGKGLFLSIGAQSCISSKGVHVHACGPRGSGKSDGAEKASGAIPTSHLLVGSASPKALYYLGERLPAGAVVYLDDIGWNDQAAQMFKTCTTFYQEGATHTVVVDHMIMQFKTAPRIIFWLTTADDQTDEQIRDRLMRIDTTETPEHTKEVIDFIFQQRKTGAASFDSREIEVCRAIIYLLKQVFIDVVIPFSDNFRYEGDPRGATIFADLVSAFAVWRHRTRKHDSNGAIIACYEDYKDAETFFNAIKGHGDTKYTPGELRVLQAIKDLSGEATREMVMAKTGMSKGGLSDVLNGRSHEGQAKYGLLHKCPALTEDDESTQKRIDEDTKTSRRKKVYRLPKDYDIMKAYSKAVYLSDETTIKRTCSLSSCGFVDGSQIKNEFGKDIVRKFVEYNSIRERRANKHKLSRVDGENFFSFSRGAKVYEPTNFSPSGSDLHLRTSVRTHANFERTKPDDSDSKPTNQCGDGEISDAAITMFKRIYTRASEIGSPTTPGQMAILMRANDHDIGIEACRELIDLAKEYDRIAQEATNQQNATMQA